MPTSCRPSSLSTDTLSTATFCNHFLQSSSSLWRRVFCSSFRSASARLSCFHFFSFFRFSVWSNSVRHRKKSVAAASVDAAPSPVMIFDFLLMLSAPIYFVYYLYYIMNLLKIRAETFTYCIKGVKVTDDFKAMHSFAERRKSKKAAF